jgi:ketosteroid isomerase-like protein
MQLVRIVAYFASVLGLCAAVSGGPSGAQSTPDAAAVRAASKAFYEALATLDDGSAMANIWAKTPYVTYLSPSGSTITVGWDALQKIWADNSRYTKRNVSLQSSHVHAVGNLAWEMGIETGDVVIKDGTSRRIDANATNIYEFIGGRWLIVSHHASQRPK